VEVLALVHQQNAPAGSFGDVVREHGHTLDVRGFATGDPPARDYDAVLVFGGSAQVDQPHDWLTDERDFVRALIDRGVPTLGVCLGSQLLAQVAGGETGPAPAPEVGWYEVGLTREASGDPLFRALPGRFAAFQWHSYGFGLPPGATALAHGPEGALQACRVGEAAWGIQFHAEVTGDILEGWIEEDEGEELSDPAAMRELTRANLPRWSALGRGLCARFLEFAALRRAARSPSP
jgi:GMP synthase-like glutamine amidotransferase